MKRKRGVEMFPREAQEICEPDSWDLAHKVLADHAGDSPPWYEYMDEPYLVLAHAGGMATPITCLYSKTQEAEMILTKIGYPPSERLQRAMAYMGVKP